MRLRKVVLSAALGWVLALGLVAFSTVDMQAAVKKKAKKKHLITLCHKPGTPAEETIRVDYHAHQAHYDHGDYSGACTVPKN